MTKHPTRLGDDRQPADNLSVSDDDLRALDAAIDAQDVEELDDLYDAWDAEQAARAKEIADEIRRPVKKLLDLLGPSDAKAALRWVPQWIKQAYNGGRKPNAQRNEAIARLRRERESGTKELAWHHESASLVGMKKPDSFGRQDRRLREKSKQHLK